MIVRESFVAAKSGRDEDCEDGIVVTDAFAAVVDGATDKGSLRFDDMTPGRFAMRACLEAVRALDPRSDAESAVAHLTSVLADRIPSGAPSSVGPTAVAAIYSASRKEIWSIGDVSFWHEGLPADTDRFKKVVDRYAAEIRGAITTAILASGEDPEKVAVNDPGRAAIRSILENQGVFKNNPRAGKWAYPALDGTPIHRDMITVTPVPSHLDEIILASDGYPAIFPTLQETEQHLARLLEEDPLCIGPLAGTKGVLPGNESFDDRSYLRISVRSPARLPRTSWDWEA